jgi:peptidoglycan LD-endopeptidase LytH
VIRCRRAPAVRILAAIAVVMGGCGGPAPRDPPPPAGVPAPGVEPGSAIPIIEPPPTGARSEGGAPPGAIPPGSGGLDTPLGMPVAGVAREDLRDSYDEPRGEGRHEAIDIPAPRGTAVLSVVDGRVLRLFDSRPGGLMVYAADASGDYILVYGHLDRYADALRDGMPLVRGQVIGYVGTTGNAPETNPHLHFAILRAGADRAWWKGTPVNPYPLLVP